MKQKYTEEFIDQYLLGKLGDQEVLSFEAELNSEPGLRERVRLQRELMNAINDLEQDEAVKKVIQSSGTRYFGSSKQMNIGKVKMRRIRILPIVAVAASIALIIVAIQFLNRSAPHGTSLYAEYFEPAPMLEFERSSTTEELDSTLFRAYVTYQDGNYSQASINFNQYLTTHSPTPVVLHYTAMAALSKPSSDVELAVELFKDLINLEDSVYSLSAKWNLALIYVRQDNWSEARGLLNNIVQANENKYTGRAKELLQKIP